MNEFPGGLDINHKPRIPKVLIYSADVLKNRPDIFKSEDGVYWENFKKYSHWVREGKPTNLGFGIDKNAMGTVIELLPGYHTNMKWCIERFITPETDPEYYI